MRLNVQAENVFLEEPLEAQLEELSNEKYQRGSRLGLKIADFGLSMRMAAGQKSLQVNIGRSVCLSHYYRHCTMLLLRLIVARRWYGLTMLAGAHMLSLSSIGCLKCPAGAVASMAAHYVLLMVHAALHASLSVPLYCTMPVL